MNEMTTMPAMRTLPCIVLLLGSALVACDSATDSSSSGEPAAITEEARLGLTSEQASKVIVQVGERRITVGEFADQLHSQSPYLRARYTSPERRREFLENLIRFELLAQAAEKAGHGTADAVKRVREDAMVEEMMKELFDKKTIVADKIEDAEVATYYEQHPSEFTKPAQVRASHIVVGQESRAKALLAQLQAAPDDEKLFASLASSKSLDADTSGREGDLRFFSRIPDDEGANVPKSVRKAAFALTEPGELYPDPVKSRAGYHVVRLTARRDGYLRTQEDAEQVIRNLLWRNKRKEAIARFVDKLRAGANIQTNQALLDNLP